jgi:hypothetical protein
MGSPPSEAGAVKVTDAVVFPAVAVPIVGAPGAVLTAAGAGPTWVQVWAAVSILTSR